MDGKNNSNLELTVGAINQLANMQKEELKVTLLEQHLMKAREEYNELKKDLNESTYKQETVIAEMYRTISEMKNSNEMFSDAIGKECEKIRTEMMTAWQDSVSEQLNSRIDEAAAKAFAQAGEVIKRQNEIILEQGDKIHRMINGYKVMKYLCYAIIVVAVIVFAAYPIGLFSYNSITSLFAEGSYISAALIIALVIAMLILAIILTSKITKAAKEKDTTR